MRKYPYKSFPLEMPVELHQVIKQMAFDTNISMTKYILGLIRTDLTKKNIKFN